jgi:hypothetical protein
VGNLPQDTKENKKRGFYVIIEHLPSILKSRITTERGPVLGIWPQHEEGAGPPEFPEFPPLRSLSSIKIGQNFSGSTSFEESRNLTHKVQPVPLLHLNLLQWLRCPPHTFKRILPILYTVGKISSVYGERLMFVNVPAPSKEEDLTLLRDLTPIRIGRNVTTHTLLCLVIHLPLGSTSCAPHAFHGEGTSVVDISKCSA